MRDWPKVSGSVEFWSQRSIKTSNHHCTDGNRRPCRRTHLKAERTAIFNSTRPQCASSMPKAPSTTWYESQLEAIAGGPRKNYV